MSLQAQIKLAKVKISLTLSLRPVPSPSLTTKSGILLWIRLRKPPHRQRKRQIRSQIRPKVSINPIKQYPTPISLPTPTSRTPLIFPRTTPLPRVKNPTINRCPKTRAQKLLLTMMQAPNPRQPGEDVAFGPDDASQDVDSESQDVSSRDIFGSRDITWAAR